MVKIGIVGTGHLGKIHIKCLKNIENADIVGFFEPNDETATEVQKNFGLQRFSTQESLLNSVQAIDIISPTVFHYSWAMEAMSQGKHVFLEKPITATLEQSKEIVECAKTKNLKVQIGHVERFNDAFLNAKPFFDNPMFIEAHRLAEFNPRGTDVSVVLDLMIHDIDIILSIIKSEVRNISASGVAVVSQTPDIANARIEFENGATANLTASRIALKKMRKMRIFQPNAYITMDFLEKNANVMRLRDYRPEDEEDLMPLILDLGEGKGKKRIFIENPKQISVNAIETELSLFIKSVEENIPCPVGADDGHKALTIACRIIDQLHEVKKR